MRATDHTGCCCAQIADHRAHNTPFSTYVTEVVCDFGAAPPQAATSSPAIGGMTPSKPPTRRRHAVRGLRMAQNPHHHRSGEHLRGRRARPRRLRASAGYCQSPATGTRTTPGQDIIRPTTTAPGRFGTKLSQHTPLTACPVQNSPRSPKMAQFGAIYACRESFVPLFGQRNTEQGEFCTEHEAELGLATTAQQAPLVRKVPEKPEGLPAVPADGLRAWPGFETRHRDHPTQISHIISLGHFSR